MNARAWQRIPELGTEVGLWFLVRSLQALGRRPAEWMLRPIVAYYVARYPGIRRASANYLARVGVEPTPRAVSTHVFTFAACAIHRFLFVADNVSGFRIENHATEVLLGNGRAGTGAVLLGAHLGSFEALRAASRRTGARVNAVMDMRNAQLMRRFLERHAPDANVGILEVGADPTDLMLRARDCVERGEFVSILADRVGPGQRSTQVQFLGGTAELPTGPFLLAAHLRCPVYLVFGLYLGDGAYELVAEEFAERVELPRADRDGALAAYAQRFAERLEVRCRQAPYNWFNFFDYWSD
ncbi:MAG: hypothetical protein R3A78_12120 [Polyangiales bacterium]|nr:hypothetical protein [Myxococcales bacterium]